MRILATVGVALAFSTDSSLAFAAPTQAICKGADRDLGYYYRLDLDDRQQAARITMVIPGYTGSDANTPRTTEVVQYSPERIHLREGVKPRQSSEAKPTWGVPLAYKRLRRSENFVLDRIEGTMMDQTAITDENGREVLRGEVEAIIKDDMERLYLMPDSAFEHGREYELSLLKFSALVTLVTSEKRFTCKKVTDKI